MANRSILRWAYVVAGVVGVCCIVYAPLLLLRTQSSPHLLPLRIVVITAAEVLAVAWWGFIFLRVYSLSDEFQREREKSAWYFGSAIGLGASVPPSAFIGAGGLHWL